MCPHQALRFRAAAVPGPSPLREGLGVGVFNSKRRDIRLNRCEGANPVSDRQLKPIIGRSSLTIIAPMASASDCSTSKDIAVTGACATGAPGSPADQPSAAAVAATSASEEGTAFVTAGSSTSADVVASGKGATSDIPADGDGPSIAMATTTGCSAAAGCVDSRGDRATAIELLSPRELIIGRAFAVATGLACATTIGAGCAASAAGAA